MVGPRLFRSRWSALLWAGGILWTAYDVADATPDRGTVAAGNATGGDVVDATGAAVDAKDLAVLANMGAN
ncbi:hypothetical protein [Sphingomonas bacterium]|uniref:hypothetical protein n=1 Tax=Sphingomonas bacterium TaxID=1895847 RepID=UPI001575F166|nr:hypothetical protein [Sphingomonas bacterium]